MKECQYDLFFSYSRSSLNMADIIIDKLEKYGLLVWYDRTDVQLGCNIKDNLYNVLKIASNWIGFIALIDKEYLKKQWCTMELDYAINNNYYIMPILLYIEKSDLPEQYNLINQLNVITIRDNKDIRYAINKVLNIIIEKIKICKLFKIENDLFYSLVESYNNKTRVDVEKIICADNIASYLETLGSKNIGHYERVLINIIHIKTKDLYLGKKISLYDAKTVFHSVDKLLSGFYTD